LRIVTYSSNRDNQPKAHDLSWEDLSGILCEQVFTPCGPASEAPCIGKHCPHKLGGTAWSPVDIPEGLTRLNDHVAAVTVAVFDLDHLSRVQIVDIGKRLQTFAYVVHSTHNHLREGPEDYCVRLVMPLSAPVPAAQWREFLAKAIAFLQVPADPSCKDLSRLYFLPNAPLGGPKPITAKNAGAALDVESILGTPLQVVATMPRPAVVAVAISEAPRLTEAERAAALQKLGNSLNRLETENKDLAEKIVTGQDILGPRGADAATGHPGQDAMLQKTARLVAAMADPGLSAGDLLDVLKPSLQQANWGDGYAHLLGEALLKLQRAVEYWREKKAQEVVDAERLRAATVEALERKLGKPETPEEPPPSGGGGVEYDPLTDAPEPAPQASGETWQSVGVWNSNKHGEPTTLAADPANVFAWLAHNPEWKGALRLNEVTQEVELHGRVVTDSDLTEIRNNLARELEALRFGTPTIAEQAALVARLNKYDPLRDYLEGITHDGTSRLETWAHDYLGVAYENELGEDITLYVRAVAKRWMIGAVARALRPGCKMDTVLILEGPQGVGKSTALSILGGEWFSDDGGAAFGDKDSKQLISRVWIQEMPELAGMRKADSEAMKAWFSRAEDYYRAPYARTPQRHPRRCVFAGTTNADDFLQDDTGNRRYWPLKCTAVDLEGLRAVRDQLWAEAVALFKAGEHWHVTTEEAGFVNSETATRMRIDETWSARLLRWWIEQGRPDEVDTSSALRGLNFTEDRMGRAEQTRVGLVLKDLGFVRLTRRIGGRVARIYVPGAALKTLTLADVPAAPAKSGLHVVKAVEP
jgi:predicted P-loop ATPase